MVIDFTFTSFFGEEETAAWCLEGKPDVQREVGCQQTQACARKGEQDAELNSWLYGGAAEG